MPRLEIVELGDPTLRKVCKKVKDVFDPKIQKLIQEMFHSLDKARGVGLAAPQVGQALRIFLVSPEGKHKAPYTSIEDTLVVINPSLEYISKKTAYDWEGCLSIPGFRGQVKRPDKVRLSYTNFLGESCVEEYEGFTARIIQHEYDHLEGVLFLDRMESLDSLMTDGYFQKLVDAHEAES